jgi:hypothetical protein
MDQFPRLILIAILAVSLLAISGCVVVGCVRSQDVEIIIGAIILGASNLVGILAGIGVSIKNGTKLDTATAKVEQVAANHADTIEALKKTFHA